MLGCVLHRLSELRRFAPRSRPLDRHRLQLSPAPAEEELGRRGDDTPPLGDEGRRSQRAEVRESPRQRARIALEGGLEVLHEVDLVDVPARDRRSHLLDRGTVLRRSPRTVPTPDRERALVTISCKRCLARDSACGQGKRGTGLGRTSSIRTS